jgi:hypothetical protein
VNELNDRTSDIRKEFKKRKVEDVFGNYSFVAPKKCNNEHILAEPSSTLLSGQSLFTSLSYLPENTDDPYWGNSNSQTTGSHIARGSGGGPRNRGRGKGRGRGRRKKEQ